MREPTFLLLTALADGPKHGYAIVKAVAEMSDGRVRLAAGTLYGALDRLSAEGLVELDREELVQGRPRRTYRITAAGHRELRETAERMATSAALALSRLGA